MALQHTVYLFDRFRLDVTRRKLLSGSGVVLPLNSRAMEALLLLVTNAGEVIDRRRLMQTVWPHTIVEDNNLNQCILAIRRALGEVAGSNQFVMTVPGRGFCFVCPVRTAMQESAEPVAATVDPGTPPVTQSTSAAARPAARPWAAATNWTHLAASLPFWLGFTLGAVSVAAVLFALH
jgi:DNA-binding winged helix-turn-helix (wHTH) protein